MFAGFTLSMGLPSWRWEIEGVTLERSVLMPARHNTVHITFRLIGAATGVRLRLRPYISFRQLEAAVDKPLADGYRLIVQGRRYEVYQGPDLPTLRMIMAGCDGSTFTADGGQRNEHLYRTEAERGYEARGWVWSPGYFTAELRPDCAVTLIAGTEDWHTMSSLIPEQARRFEIERRRRLVAMAEPELRSRLGAELVLAADLFIITPVGRVADIARAHAEGDEVRTVIAGYHWFTDWGRDTMISLEGLTLVTGRVEEAKWILRAFADYVRGGLIPNMFPEGDTEGLYHTADATLWFFHAVARYLAHCPDETTLGMLLPKMHEMVRHHIEGCNFGIRVDPQDGLLTQGAEGYQLTWMDAKVGDWVVTPRRGKAVEINALWYNALCLLRDWLRAGGHAEAGDIAARAEQARRSFNRRFWYDKGGYLYDIVDGETGDDPSFRPNQIMAISLDHPVLDEERWRPVVDAVREKLLDPGWAAFAGARRAGLQVALFRRSAGARRGLSPGDGVGLADRPVYRRLDADLSRQEGSGPRLPVRVRGASRRGRDRHDQRDLRRRAAVHAARLHRAGMERRRGAALPRKDGAVILINRLRSA